MVHRLLFATATACLLTGCGIKLPAGVPNAQDGSQLAPKSDVVYDHDPSYSGMPQDWIGRVGVVFTVPDPTTKNPTCTNKGKIEWVTEHFRDGGKIDYNDAVTTKRILYKSVVDDKFVANVEAMKFLAAELSGNVVLKVLLTEIVTQRHAVGEQWKKVRTAFEENESNKKKYLDVQQATNVCYVVVVGGYAYNILTREKFQKMQSKVGATYAGINVNGEYFNSTEQFALDDVYALSLEILRRPSKMGVTDGVARTEADRVLTPDDASFLRDVTTNSSKPMPWSGKAPKP